ncbi:MAG: GDSL-type esterase/lipase family protein [Oscillospiraceae bacterium]|nr:GDSL-type esterase/lipase family protein [Oscillospiraceae bacterium]
MKKILSIVLCVVMLFALTVPAFAASGKNYYDYENYMCVGDSIAAGCGLARDGKPTNFDQTVDDYTKVYSNNYIYLGYDFNAAPAAYHSLVANELGANLLQCARSALRAVEFRYFLDGTYNDYDESCIWGNIYYDSDGNGFALPDLDAVNAYVNYPEKIKQADLLSINVGSNDVFSFTLNVVLRELTKDTSDPTLSAIKDFLDKTGNVGAAFGKLIDAYQSMGKTADLVRALTETMNKAYNQFTVNYEAIMKEVYKLNPDITVVGVGVYNPFTYFRLSEDNQLDLSGIAAPIVTAINAHIASYKLKYDNFYYADVVGTETYPMNYDDRYFWEYFTLKVHPTIEGHQFMAQQILEALPEAPLPAPAVTSATDPASGKIMLKWAAVKNAEKYEVYRSSSKGGLYTKKITTDELGCTDTSAKAGYTYYYKVRAVTADGTKGDYSSVVYRTCDCAAPVVKGGNNAATGKVTLTWDKVSGAKEYVVYRADYSNGTYTKMYTTKNTSYTNTTANAGYTYYYKVKAISYKTAYADSAMSNMVTRTCDCAAPVVKIALNSDGHPKLTWDKVTGAEKYRVYRSTDGKNFSYYYTATATYFNNNSATAGTTYYYKVMAASARTSYADSAMSSVVSIRAK